MTMTRSILNFFNWFNRTKSTHQVLPKLGWARPCIAISSFILAHKVHGPGFVPIYPASAYVLECFMLQRNYFIDYILAIFEFAYFQTWYPQA